MKYILFYWAASIAVVICLRLFRRYVEYTTHTTSEHRPLYHGLLIAPVVPPLLIIALFLMAINERDEIEGKVKEIIEEIAKD